MIFWNIFSTSFIRIKLRHFYFYEFPRWCGFCSGESQTWGSSVKEPQSEPTHNLLHHCQPTTIHSTTTTTTPLASNIIQHLFFPVFFDTVSNSFWNWFHTFTESNCTSLMVNIYNTCEVNTYRHESHGKISTIFKLRVVCKESLHGWLAYEFPCTPPTIHYKQLRKNPPDCLRGLCCGWRTGDHQEAPRNTVKVQLKVFHFQTKAGGIYNSEFAKYITGPLTHISLLPPCHPHQVTCMASTSHPGQNSLHILLTFLKVPV